MLKRIATIVIWVGLFMAAWQYQVLLDWWELKGYEPPAPIAALADKTSMTVDGRKLFYLAAPQLSSKSEFGENCPVGELRESLVLGCYAGGDIYLLAVDRTELNRVVEVTAAHEMLHAAYERLGRGERTRIDALVQAFYRGYDDAKLTAIVKQYQQSEPGQLSNELHSLLATEVRVLSPELENYYQRYFSNRQKVVLAFQEYEAVFTKLNDQREQLLAKISSLRTQIEALKKQADTSAKRASQLGQQIDRLREQQQIAESNTLVSQQNEAARQANSLNSQLSSLVREHNRYINQVNRLALYQNDLLQSLDSRDFTSG